MNTYSCKGMLRGGRTNFKLVHGVVKEMTFSGQLTLCKHMNVYVKDKHDNSPNRQKWQKKQKKVYGIIF